jgi:hypothetical protein
VAAKGRKWAEAVTDSLGSRITFFGWTIDSDNWQQRLTIAHEMRHLQVNARLAPDPGGRAALGSYLTLLDDN